MSHNNINYFTRRKIVPFPFDSTKNCEFKYGKHFIKQQIYIFPFEQFIPYNYIPYADANTCTSTKPNIILSPSTKSELIVRDQSITKYLNYPILDW